MSREYDAYGNPTPPKDVKIVSSTTNSYPAKLDLLEEALRNRSEDTVIFVDTDEREYELCNVSYNKQVRGSVVQTVILLEVR